MNEEIKPRMEDGIGYCDDKCPKYTWYDGMLCEILDDYLRHPICIPWLRTQFTELAKLLEFKQRTEDLFKREYKEMCEDANEAMANVRGEDDQAKRIYLTILEWKKMLEEYAAELKIKLDE